MCKPTLIVYFATTLIQPFLNEADWTLCHEMEGVLRISRILTTAVQYEHQIVSSYGPVIQNVCQGKYVKGEIDLIDLEKWVVKNKPPRVAVNVDTFSHEGRVCRRLVLLELERAVFLGIQEKKLMMS